MQVRRPGLAVASFALTVALAACGSVSVAVQSPAPTTPAVSGIPGQAPGSSAAPSSAASGAAGASPSAEPVASSSAEPEPWAVAAVAEPSAVTTAPSLEPGYQCHPCHYLAENDFLGVAHTPYGTIAVGVQQPPAQAVAFVSSDGTHWTGIAGLDAVEGSSAAAVAASAARVVIVGLDHSGATAWASSDGATWTQAPPQADLEVPYVAGGMTAVSDFGNGFVAGGYRDDPLHDRRVAAVWRSSDGLTWRLDRAGSIFDGGRVWGIAAKGGTIVAVGTGGDPNYGPAAVWRWTASTGWQRGRIGPDAGGAMRAVTATPSGFVAVGLDAHDQGAMTWTSTDGLTWTAGADQPAFHFGQNPVRMQAVVATPRGLVAGGWRSDQGKGSAVTWISTDGLTWQGPAWESSFSGGEITGVAVVGDTVAAVGRTGYPDWNQASAWLAPIP